MSILFTANKVGKVVLVSVRKSVLFSVGRMFFLWVYGLTRLCAKKKKKTRSLVVSRCLARGWACEKLALA
jgi:hypothetical protein